MKRKAVKKEKGSILEPHFTDEDKAREYLEAMRWPEGPICPHCGLIGEAYKLTPKVKEPVPEHYQTKQELKKERVRKPRKGLWKCAGCRKQFTVTVKTIFEDSHIPLHKWLLAIHLLCSSKKGMSAHQLMRNLGIKQYKSAWFMAHRIRYAMTGELPEKMGGIVECDETYISGRIRVGKQPLIPGQRKPGRTSHTANKAPVFAMLQRGSKVVSRHVERITAETLKPVIEAVIAEDAHMMTDTSTVLRNLGKGRRHSLVNHTASEYVRRDEGVCITTDAVEGYFSTAQAWNKRRLSSCRPEAPSQILERV
jgi:transposase-like protein